MVHHPIDVAALLGQVAGSGRGGQVLFVGTVRDHHAGRGVRCLEYSAYLPMAVATLEALIRETTARWPVTIAVQHRVGRLEIGEVAVAVAVAGDHRDESFAACRHLIEELKVRVPIWKREYYVDGTEAWVDPTAQPAPTGVTP